MYTANELLFPAYVVPSLRDLRGPKWAALVDSVVEKSECNEEKLAFMLMMIRLNGCMACETDSYRAMRGCAACAHQTLRRYKGTDEELLTLYHTALEDIRSYYRTGTLNTA
ncbi:MAG: hypothetical protein ACOCX5_04065 [Chloroflexota bacterium]